MATHPHPAPVELAAHCHLEIDAPVEIEVELIDVEEPLGSVTVRPLRHQIRAKLSGRRFTIAVSGPGHLVIEPNGGIHHPLFIFVSPPPTRIPRPEEVTHYFGPGEHVIGVTALHSGDRVYLHPEALVRGHFVGDGVEDVHLFGHGTIHGGKSPGAGDPAPRRNEYGEHRPLLSFRDSRRIHIEGLHLLDSPAWTCQLFNTNEAHLHDLRIISCRENGDGIDVVNGEHVRIEGCFLRTWDDALCLKTQLSRRGEHGLLWTAIGMGQAAGLAWNTAALERLECYRTHDIMLRNCVIWLDRAHALEIGFETTGSEISKILFEDIDIVHDFHYAPMDISLSDRADVHDVVFRGIHIEDSRAPFIANLHVGDTYCSVDRWFGIDFGCIRNVVFEDIHVHAPHLLPVKIHARPLAAPRLATEFTPLCDGLPVLAHSSLPPGVRGGRPQARPPGDPLIENVVFRNWTLHGPARNVQVSPTLHFTPESREYVKNIQNSPPADIDAQRNKNAV